jgi:hypothetical protein
MRETFYLTLMFLLRFIISENGGLMLLQYTKSLIYVLWLNLIIVLIKWMQL